MIVAFVLGLGFCHVCFLCSDLFISGIDNYTSHKVCGSLRVYFIGRFCICIILFIVFWDIAPAAFLQLLVYKQPPSVDVEAQ